MQTDDVDAIHGRLWKVAGILWPIGVTLSLAMLVQSYISSGSASRPDMWGATVGFVGLIVFGGIGFIRR
jgi:hypothetical protein